MDATDKKAEQLDEDDNAIATNDEINFPGMVVVGLLASLGLPFARRLQVDHPQVTSDPLSSLFHSSPFLFFLSTPAPRTRRLNQIKSNCSKSSKHV